MGHIWTLWKQIAPTLPSMHGMFQRGPSDIDAESRHSRSQRWEPRYQRDGVRCFECSAVAQENTMNTDSKISKRVSYCNSAIKLCTFILFLSSGCMINQTEIVIWLSVIIESQRLWFINKYMHVLQSEAWHCVLLHANTSNQCCQQKKSFKDFLPFSVRAKAWWFNI